MIRVDMFPGPEEFRDFFKTAHGPTIAVHRSLAEDPERTAALDCVRTDLAGGALREGAMQWDFLLLTARKVGADAV